MGTAFTTRIGRVGPPATPAKAKTLSHKSAMLGLVGPFFVLLLLYLLATPAAAFVSSGRLIQSQQPASTAMVVKVGVYVRKIYDFDSTTDTFQCTFDLWMSWTTPDSNDNQTTAIVPTRSTTVSNAIDISTSVLSPVSDSPITSDNKTFSMLFHAQARIARTFDLSGFPLDEHSLDIVLEDLVNPSSVIAYVPDEEQSGFDADFNIPGWIIGGMKSRAAVHDYGSGLGVFPKGTTFPAVVFSISVDRGTFLLTWQLTPLIFLLILSWLALLVNPDKIDSRIALCTTALLTAVFLQQAALPLFNRTYLALLDNIYIMAYVLFVVNFFVVLLDELQFAAAEAAEDAGDNHGRGDEESKGPEEEMRLISRHPDDEHEVAVDAKDGVFKSADSSNVTITGSSTGSSSSSNAFEMSMKTVQHDVENGVAPVAAATLPSEDGPATAAAAPRHNHPHSDRSHAAHGGHGEQQAQHVPFFLSLDSLKSHRFSLTELFKSTTSVPEMARRIKLRDLLLMCLEVVATIVVVTVLCVTAPDANSVVGQV